MAHCTIPDIPLAERRAYTMGEAAGLAGLSVSHLYALMARGQLRSVRVGARRLIPREALDELLANREPKQTLVAAKPVRTRRGAASQTPLP